MSLRYFNAAGASADGVIGEDFDVTLNLVPLVLQGQPRPATAGPGVRHGLPDARRHGRPRLHPRRRPRRLATSWPSSTWSGGGASRAVNLGTGVGHVGAAGHRRRRAGQRRAGAGGVRRPPPGRPGAIYADNRLAAEVLGWEPERGLDEILASAWRWHSAHPEGFRKD